MAKQDSRIRIKRSTTTGEVPTVAPSTDHTDGTWDALDVYVGELFLNTVDDRLWVRTDNGIKEVNTVKTARLEIPSADVLTWGTPIPFGLTVPSGYAASAIQAYIKVYGGASVYTTNTNVVIRAVGSGGGSYQLENSTALTALTAIESFIPTTPTSGMTMLIDGADLESFVDTSNPLAGDGDVVIYLTYMLIQL